MGPYDHVMSFAGQRYLHVSLKKNIIHSITFKSINYYNNTLTKLKITLTFTLTLSSEYMHMYRKVAKVKT